MKDDKKIGRPFGKADLSKAIQFVEIDMSLGKEVVEETIEQAKQSFRERGLFPRLWPVKTTRLPGLIIKKRHVVGYLGTSENTLMAEVKNETHTNIQHQKEVESGGAQEAPEKNKEALTVCA